MVWKSVDRDPDAIIMVAASLKNTIIFSCRKMLFTNIMSYPPVRLHLADFDTISTHFKPPIIQQFYYLLTSNFEIK
jgi:hypothetical protein